MADKDFCVCDLGLECVYHGILHPRAAAPTPVEPPQGDCMGCHFADMKHRSDCPNRPAIPAEPERDHRFVTLPAPTFLGMEEHGYSTGGTSSSPAKPAESQGVERVTDDAKQGEPTHHHFARVPAHTYLGTEEQGYSTGGTDMYRSITQPAKHTDDKETLLKSSRVKETDENLTQNAADDRPAETIPDKLKQQLADMTLERDAYKQANLTNAETIILLQKRKYCRHEKVSQGTLADEGYMVVCDDCGEDLTPAAKSREPGRAETRIEVLEAVIEAHERIDANKYVEWGYAGTGVANECSHGYAKFLACPRCDLETIKAYRATLAAPSGDTTKEKV